MKLTFSVLAGATFAAPQTEITEPAKCCERLMVRLLLPCNLHDIIFNYSSDSRFEKKCNSTGNFTNFGRILGPFHFFCITFQPVIQIYFIIFC